MPSPILARADALMQRKRQSDAQYDDLPVLTDAISDDDDIPVLVDAESANAVLEAEPAAIVAPPPETEPLEMFWVIEPIESEGRAEPVEIAAPPPPESHPAIDGLLREQLIRELARRVEQRLSAELPRLIESTVCDFLAEQEMITGLSAHD